MLSMLGYGNMSALVNDPRANPRARDDANDIDAEGAAAAANCAVRLTSACHDCTDRPPLLRVAVAPDLTTHPPLATSDRHAASKMIRQQGECEHVLIGNHLVRVTSRRSSPCSCAGCWCQCWW
jgi:hypothetical protein